MFQTLLWPFTMWINCYSDLKCPPCQAPDSHLKKNSITKTILSHKRSEQLGKQNTKSNLTEKISLKIKQKLNDAGCIEGKLANDFQYTHNQPEIGSLSQTSADKRFPLLFTCYCQYRFWFPWLCISLVCILISINWKKYIP